MAKNKIPAGKPPYSKHITFAIIEELSREIC